MKGSGTTSSFEATIAVGPDALLATKISLSPPTDTRPEPTESRPPRIGRYLIVDELGRGGMGVVYAAYDPELDRKVAIKFLLGEGRDPDAKARLLREAQSMARLSHAHVVHVHDVGTTEEGAVFIAMEYIQGQTLGQWLKSSPHTSAEILKLFRQAGEGLAAAHAVELIHRDFKPDNVLLTPAGEAKISDFGLARPVAIEAEPLLTTPPLNPLLAASEDTPNDNASTVLTQTGTILGTPAYMAPEQHLGQQADARSDQYSFCVTLFEALYGHRPFSGKNIGELRLRVLGGLIEEPPATAGVPRWIFPVLARGLQVEPDERWPTITDLLVALDNDPNRTRRRWLVGAGLIAVLGAGVFYVQHSRAAQVEASMRACTAPERALGDYWQRERPRIRKAIVAVSTPGVQRMATLADDGLTTFVDGWRKTQRQTCEAALHKETLTDEMLALRMTCLDRQRGRVESVIELFEDTDNALLGHINELLSTLPRPEHCTDFRYLARLDSGGADEPIEAAIEALRRRLFHVEAELKAGRYKEGQVHVMPLLEEALALGDRELIAHVRLAHGRLATENGLLDVALSSYLTSLREALSLGAEHLAAKIANHLTYHTGYYQGMNAEAQRWSEVAAGLVDRTGDNDLLLQHLNYLGAIQTLGGDHMTALATYDRARVISEEVGVTPHDEAALANNRGIILAYLGRNEEAKIEHEHALALITQWYGEQHPDVALTSNSLGAVLISEGKLTRAIEHFERARAIQEQVLNTNHPHLALTLINLASANSELGNQQRALSIARRAQAILESIGFSESVFNGYTELVLGDAHLRLGDPKGSAHLEHAIEILEVSLGPDHVHLSLPLLSLAEHALSTGDADLASAHFKRITQLQKKDSNEISKVDLIRVHVLQARLLAGSGDRKEAARILREAEDSYTRLKPHYTERARKLAELRRELEAAD